jgi:excisionase family DNA binding protein
MATDREPLEHLLTAKEVAIALSVGEDQVRDYVAQGLLKAIRLGQGPKRRMRFTRLAVQAFLDGPKPGPFFEPPDGGQPDQLEE